MNCIGMVAPHRDRHASDAAGERTAAQKSAPVQCLHHDAFFNAELAQALGLGRRKGVPVDMVDMGRLA